ncbi:MAG TPA: hypothetical protein VLV89_07010, partial [Candidatus Acidoferrum sp.]|nr:hypothetical protein [Candidatus Acidoferrum sp.]
MPNSKMNRAFALLVALLIVSLFPGMRASAQSMRPEAEKNLAREIYKEFIEVRSGFTTGSTTPVAEAAARRLRAAGFPDSDIFIGGERDDDVAIRLETFLLVLNQVCYP